MKNDTITDKQFEEKQVKILKSIQDDIRSCMKCCDKIITIIENYNNQKNKSK